MRKTPRIALLALLALCPARMAAAQGSAGELDFSLPAQSAPGSFRSAQELDLNPGYDSKPIGKRKRWRLDSGGFSDERETERLRPGEDPLDSYSGIRLRQPFGSKK